MMLTSATRGLSAARNCAISRALPIHGDTVDQVSWRSSCSHTARVAGCSTALVMISRRSGIRATAEAMAVVVASVAQEVK